MSHLVLMKLKIKSFEGARQTLTELGGTVEESDVFSFYPKGYQRDSPLPQGFTEESLFGGVAVGKARCHYRAKFPGTNYEVGIIQVKRLPQDHPVRQLRDEKGNPVYTEDDCVILWDYWDHTLCHILCGDKIAYNEQGQPKTTRFNRSYIKASTLLELQKKYGRNVKMTETQVGNKVHYQAEVG